MSGRGYWLLLARIGWLVIVVPTFVLFLANIPAYWLALHRPYVPGTPLFTGQLTLADISTLQSWGLSLDFYAICMVAISLLFQLSYAAMGVLLFWRRSNDRAALFASFALMMLPFGFAYLTLQALPQQWHWLIPTTSAIGNASIMLCAYVLPDGRFAPRWIGWLALLLVGYWASPLLLPAWVINSLFLLLIFFGLIASTIIVQVYRYHYVSTLQQRQQTKWLVYGVSIAAAANLGTRLLFEFVLLPLSGDSFLLDAFYVILVTCSMLVIPPTLGMAIFRSRLWNIDVIINRTLVYTMLTATLGLVYAALVIVLQFLLRGLTGGNQLALVGSTLAIAALFQPLKSRLQAIIDRRFYRRKYDAARTVEMFSTALRDEVDLNQLGEQLVTVVEETMQPAHVSLWLRPVEYHGKRTDTETWA